MLILVVGPSGAGKDTVLGLARQALAGNQRFRFVRRVITRPVDAGGEDHESVSDSEFARRKFALHWQAHGLHYGIPTDITDDIGRGGVVIANVSRGVIAQAAEKFVVQVIEITASPAVLAQRLTARGRETADDVKQRLARDIPIPDNVEIETIVNDRTPAEAADQFVNVLNRVAERVPPR